MRIEEICKSYKGAKVKILTLKGATNPIKIRKGVKQGCPSHQYWFSFALTH
jgi:hypothetical protein